MEGKLHVVMDVVVLLVLRMLLILTLVTLKLQFDAPRKEPGVTMKCFLTVFIWTLLNFVEMTGCSRHGELQLA